MPSRLPLIGFRVDAETHDKIMRIAQEKEWSVSHVVRHLVEKALKEHEVIPCTTSPNGPNGM